MDYKTNISLGEVNWKYYLDPMVNPKAKRFLDISGHEVLNQVHINIQGCIKKDSPQLEILLHPNVSSVTIIKKDEFSEVLDFCLQWFTENEEYEMCSDITKTKELLKKKNKTMVQK